MNNIKTKAVKLSLVAAGLSFAASAHATSWVDITDQMTASIDANSNATYQFGPGDKHPVTFTDFTSAPVQVALWDGNPSPNSVSDLLASLPSTGLFGLTQTSQYSGGATIDAKSSFTFNPANNSYLAVHFGSGEMLFHWTTAPAAFTLSSDKLSNYRAFTSPVPEPETYGMLLAGLGLVGFLARRRKAA